MKPNEKKKYYGYLINVSLVIIFVVIYVIADRVSNNKVATSALSYVVTLVVMLMYGVTISV
jgi:hypothetical protein